MTENEQIREMAKIISENKRCIGVNCDECEYFTVDAEVCQACYPAKEIYSKGYRKVEHGEWELGKSGLVYFCTKCNYAAHPRESEQWDFCPRCGANMRGDGK